MFKKVTSILVIMALMVSMLCGCKAEEQKKVQITVFAAKSLNPVMDELIEMYEASHPGVKIVASYDSSGTLMAQIEEGAECDVFFSAAIKQMDKLQGNGLVIENTRANIVNNQVCIVTYKNSGTTVTGLSDIQNASSMALADGSVPVGRYARIAMVNANLLGGSDEPASISTSDVSVALGGLEINECANVGAVTTAVAEGANEIGFVYYSDYRGFEDSLDIIEILPYELTGNVIYPAAVIANPNASDEMVSVSSDFVAFLRSDEAQAVFEKYYFDVNV